MVQGRKAYRRQLVEQFELLFPPQLFKKFNRELAWHRNVGWTPLKVLWLSMIMFWLPGNTLREQFSAARQTLKIIKPHWKIPLSYGGFIAAQSRSWPLMAQLIFAQLRPSELLAGDAWRIRGWLVFAVDGSRFECPRTIANEEGLGCAGRSKTSPQIFHTLLQHVGTGLPWDFRLGPGTDSERYHLNEMLKDLPQQTLFTADAGFISYELCSELIDSQQRFVLRIGGNKTLIENLEQGENQSANIVYFWPEQSQSKPPLKLRRICFASTGGLPVVLLTNILDEQILSDEDATTIYASRWGIEVYFRHLKQTFHFTQLKSRTPQNCLNEQNWRLISFWILQRMTVSFQIGANQNPRRFSAATARREIREVLQLMQQNRNGPSLKTRCLKMRIDSYERKGPKVTRKWARKKNDKPPQPPKTRAPKKHEVERAQQLGFKRLII